MGPVNVSVVGNTILFGGGSRMANGSGKKRRAGDGLRQFRYADLHSYQLPYK
jgi:hypothetical protein